MGKGSHKAGGKYNAEVPPLLWLCPKCFLNAELRTPGSENPWRSILLLLNVLFLFLKDPKSISVSTFRIIATNPLPLHSDCIYNHVDTLCWTILFLLKGWGTIVLVFNTH